MGVERFDAVVVGSGFGGSVATYRLAQEGRRVLLLERGKAWPPGDFPRRPDETAAAFWDPSEGAHGLYDAWSFRRTEALVASGLGGGSLIYANVLIRKDRNWFVRPGTPGQAGEAWPVTRDDLERHYDAVERMLGAAPYPASVPPYDRTPKTLALAAAAERLGLDWARPHLAVTFADADGVLAPGLPLREAHPNLHGRPRSTCRLCGECVIGCNFGSKNTLDLTYLSAAERGGAEIRTRCEVRRLSPRPGGGYLVGYVVHRPEAEGRPADTAALPEVEVRADRLVMAAGTLGTTFLLLKNRRALPGLGAALGTRFSGNGDLLTIVRGAARTLAPSLGPTITSRVRVADALDPDGSGRGFYVEDGGWPLLVDWGLEAADAPGKLRLGLRFLARRVWAAIARRPRSELGGELAALIGGGRLSATSLPLLAMGRDIADGVMDLRGGYLDVRTDLATSRPYLDRVRETSRAIAGALGGELRDNPLWYLSRLITVHPVGGCPMGRTAAEGVVDRWGEAFGHPGLFLVDGSVNPGPVGPNPSLTIAALADRFSDRICD